MRITFLGGGNMANALIGGLLNKGIPATDIAVIEINEAGRERLEHAYGVRCCAEVNASVLDCDVLLLAVKPQQMRKACEPLSSRIDRQLVLTIAAGLRLVDLSRWLGGYDRLVRAMPNTPALIGAGMTGLFAHPSVAEAERRGAERIMQAVGRVVWVGDESQIDAVTAISGSGPAYVFLFIEALHEAALKLGFNEKQARLLSIETALGAVKLAAQSDETAGILRERVTSRGGTTEAALAVMAQKNLKGIVIDSASAACARSAEIGQELDES
ncbi:MAG: pyrroline-5-carboxylate reductase [Candidatus Accumulibacter sp.]|jgi:pyrroline-5-carboxylate reductase|nr:pyrroline-5-carboxylate reductase [Accumulibacter sp.]